ncbi:MAG: glycosyltransferase family 4 protein [Verrucomicrobiota bacterium]
MKIAVIRKECSFRMGGAERYAANLCRAWADMGHTVYVLAERCDDDIHPDLIHVPIQVDHRSSWAKNNSFHRNSQKAVTTLEVDAVLALSRSFPADAFRVSDPLHDFWMSIRYPGKFHRFLQRLNPRHRAILALERGIFDTVNTRFIITNSQLSKRLIPQSHPYPADRIHVIYNGVDLEKFRPVARPSGRDDGAVDLLFVGQDFKRKGLGPLIEALVIVKERGCAFRLRVIGRDRPAAYRKLAARLGLTDRVIFEGPSGSIQNAYQSADLFVFPSLYDPFANVCLEALACGLPVLTTDTNGSSEVIEEDGDGYVVAGAVATLAEQLAAAICRFCALPAAERETMRTRARAKAENFTIEANARAVAQLLS